MGRRILITGISTPLGGELARRLELDPDVEHIVGIDSGLCTADLERTELIDADLRDPIVAKLIPSTGVDTVIHMATELEPEYPQNRASHDRNVMGSLQLLRACENTPGLKQVVIRSSASVYGSYHSAPSFFREQVANSMELQTGYQRDIFELENYFETFSRRHVSIAFTLMRFQPLIGPHCESPLSRYLRLAFVPVCMGYDPMLQFTYTADAVDAILEVLRRPVRGAINIASPGTISLVRMLRLLGKVTVPVAPPLFDSALSAVSRLGGGDFGRELPTLLRYGRGLDLGRMLGELQIKPAHTTTEAVEELVNQSAGRRIVGSAREAVFGTL